MFHVLCKSFFAPQHRCPFSTYFHLNDFHTRLYTHLFNLSLLEPKSFKLRGPIYFLSLQYSLSYPASWILQKFTARDIEQGW